VPLGEAIREIHRTLKPGGRFVVMDVKPFEARWKLLNPAAAAIFVPSTNWSVHVDPIAAMRDVFGNVRGVKLNRGSAFLTVSHKVTG
jgi:hypothetical protein